MRRGLKLPTWAYLTAAVLTAVFGTLGVIAHEHGYHTLGWIFLTLEIISVLVWIV